MPREYAASRGNGNGGPCRRGAGAVLPDGQDHRRPRPREWRCQADRELWIICRNLLAVGIAQMRADGDVMGDLGGTFQHHDAIAGRSAGALAAQSGITLAATSPLSMAPGPGDGIRLCFGGARTLGDLAAALSTLGAILDDSEAMALI